MTKQEAIEYALGMKEANTQEHFEMFIDIAIECIEKQIPQKAMEVYKAWDSGYVKGWTCPNCGNRHSAEYRISCADDICGDCHQLIDWSDNE